MSLNMKALTEAFAKTAAVIEKTVQTTVQEVTGPRALQDYDLLDQAGSGGPGLAWRLFSARPAPPPPPPTTRSYASGSSTSAPSPRPAPRPASPRPPRTPSSTSSAPTPLDSSASGTPASFTSFRPSTRARPPWPWSPSRSSRLFPMLWDASTTLPRSRRNSRGCLSLTIVGALGRIQAARGSFWESFKFGSTGDFEQRIEETRTTEMGLLEVKHGLLQVAESLDFIHNNARLIHRAISPEVHNFIFKWDETVFITSSGAWKLGGFGFAVSVEQMSGDINSVQPFHYSEYDVDDSILSLQPSLNYTAPELVRSKSPAVRCSADIFSFGCLTYNLVTKKPLLDCHNNVKMYMNSLTYLSSETFSAVPSDLVIDLQRMLSTDEISRPSASDFTGSPFFRDDTRLRALRFLDHMLERDNMQKSEFLKALSDMWKDFDSRILRYKVLPPLCAELRNVVMQPMILPMVLTIAESQDKVDFELSTMPALVPVLSSASGETLLLLVKRTELIINKANHEHLITGILPLLVRAYDDTDPRIQEELVKQAILTRVHSLALRTTVAAVRVNALKCLGDMVSSLDKNAVQDILQTVQRCTAVDRSAPTLMCTLAIANSIFKQHGLEFTAEHVLPLLCPLLTAQQLNVQQFAKFMLFVKDILRKIEEKRGVSVTESGDSDVRVMTSAPNGINSESVQKASVPVKSTSWDEDWGPLKRGPGTTTTTRDASAAATPTVQVSQPDSVSLPTSKSSDSVFSQQSKSPTSVDLEWPPRNPSSAFSSQTDSANEKQNQTSVSSLDGSFDDIDPFANWPPKPGNTGSGIGFGTTPISSVGSSSPPITNFGSMMNRNPMGVPMQQQGGTLSINNISGSMGSSANSSSGIKNQIDPLSMLGNPNPSMNLAAGKDLGSIFNSTNSGQLPLRLAPPPSTAISGRGRGRSSGKMRNSPKISTGQASLVDLL